MKKFEQQRLDMADGDVVALIKIKKHSEGNMAIMEEVQKRMGMHFEKTIQTYREYQDICRGKILDAATVYSLNNNDNN